MYLLAEFAGWVAHALTHPAAFTIAAMAAAVVVFAAVAAPWYVAAGAAVGTFVVVEAAGFALALGRH